MNDHPAPQLPIHHLPAAVRRLLRPLGHTPSTASHPPVPLFAGAHHRWQRLLPYAVALVLALWLTQLGAQLMSQLYGINSALALGLATAQAAPLLLAVARPVQAWWIMTAADVVGAVVLAAAPGVSGQSWPWPLAVVIGQFVLLAALTRRATRRTLLGVWLAIGAVGLTLWRAFPDKGDGTNSTLFMLGGLVLLAGGAMRERGEALRQLVEQERINADERSRRTLLEERARIARELHDVVAHHMSVITIQADSAPYRIEGVPPEAREEFVTIAATARESLAEMRRLLGVLRSEDSDDERAPQPGLDRLPHLVETSVRAGVPAELHVDGEVAALGGLPSAVELSAYRIAQEALANVVRHSPGADTRVLVSVSPNGEHLTVLVVNGTPPKPVIPLESTGTGHGLVGMRERVRLVGGALDTGPLPDGGFRVAARIPLRDKDGSAA